MATEIALSPYILLDSMLQQPGMLGDDDHWIGPMGFSKKRRKIQNRINQRAHREFQMVLCW